MITKEFKYWVEDIKTLIRRRVEKLECQVWLDNPTFDMLRVGITFFTGQMFWMSFDQSEFNHNSKKQRQKLAKIRRENLALEIRDFIKTLTKTVRVLK